MLNIKEITRLLKTRGKEAYALRNQAYAVKVENVGKVVHLRGIIELSNYCTKNCFYCGIRRENKQIERYTLTTDEVLECAQFALDAQYGSIVLQAGERTDPRFVDWITFLLKEIKKLSKDRLGITISLGEQNEKTLQTWFEAGAHRALIRLEASEKKRYTQLHPNDQDHLYEKRLEAIKLLRKTDYQMGSGVLIHTPEQTAESMARDLLFLKSIDVDMIGMGPFIPHAQTPMGYAAGIDLDEQLQWGLNMIALARLLMPDVNIASTTALQSISPHGRESGVLSGANIIMPNITPQSYRAKYQLYNGKVAIDENAQASRDALIKSIESIGETLGLDAWGDAHHAQNRQNK